MTSWKEDYPLDDLLYSLKEISNFLTGEGREDEEGRGLRESREKKKDKKPWKRETSAISSRAGVFFLSSAISSRAGV